MSWWFRRKDRKTNILKLIQIAKTWASMCAIANKIENKNINIDWFSIVWSLSNEIIRIIADNIKLNYKQEKIKQLLNSEQKINNKKINDLNLFLRILKDIDELNLQILYIEN